MYCNVCKETSGRVTINTMQIHCDSDIIHWGDITQNLLEVFIGTMFLLTMGPEMYLMDDFMEGIFKIKMLLKSNGAHMVCTPINILSK